MPDIRIDLDTPEPPPARPRRRGLLVGAVVTALALGAVLTRVLAPDEPVGPIDLRPEWSLDLPEEFGAAVAARVQGGTVLVVAELGLIAADRATGEERWRRDSPSRLSTETAWDHVRIAGNSVGLIGPTALDVIDLPSGETRFSVPHPGEVHLTLYSALVLDDRLTAYALADGRELWHHDVPEGTSVLLPEEMSYARQPAGIPNSGPSHAEAYAGVLLESNASGLSVIDVNTGDVGVTWPEDPARLRGLSVVAGAVVQRGEGSLRGLSLESGEEVWRRDWSSADVPSGPRWGLTGSLLIDASPDTGTYQLIDIDTGEGPDPLDLGGRKPVFFAPDLVVGIDPELAALTAFGRASWTTSLRPEGWTAAGFHPEGFLTGDGWLAIGGELGFGGETQRHLWAVELETGRVGSVPDGVLVGFENAALVSAAAGDRRTVRLHEVAA